MRDKCRHCFADEKCLLRFQGNRKFQVSLEMLIRTVIIMCDT